jgi:hypothetical protein
MPKTTEALDYGLDAALEAAETHGQAKAAEVAANKPSRKARKTHTTAIAELVAQGKPAPLLVFGSAANPHYDRHAQALHHHYCNAWNFAADKGHSEAMFKAGVNLGYDALIGYNHGGGMNTYAKALSTYKAILITSVAEVDSGEKPIKVTPLPELKAKAKAEAPADKPKAAAKKKASDHPVGQPLKAAAIPPINNDPNWKATPQIAETFEVDDAPQLETVYENGEPPVVVVADELDQGPAPDVVAQVPPKVVTYPTKVAATKAARQDMGDDVVEGIDFILVKVGKAWAVKQMAVG